MNKVKQTDKYTICHTIKQMYKLNEKSYLIFSWMSTNINFELIWKWSNVNELFSLCIDRLMLKAITLFRLRAVSDFWSLHFVLWLTLMKHQSVTKTKYWHTIFSQLFSFTLRHELCLMNTLQAGCFYMFCVYLVIWTRLKLKVYFACQF